MAIFVAPQAWAELRSNAGYDHGFLHFWANDYFRFGELAGLILPTWNHLWFVAYLWVYTMLFAGLALLPPPACSRLQRAFNRALGGPRLLWLPILFLWIARIALYPTFGETHALLDDVYAHLVYAFGFFFGVGLAGSDALWAQIGSSWKKALKVGIAGYLVIVVLDMTIPGESGELELLVARLARSLQAWGMIVGLLGFARLRLNLDGPVRRYLTEAVFPYYIAHQTIIVLVGYWLTPLRLGAGAQFAIILAATVAGCALTYELGRRVDWLRPLIGLKRRAKTTERAKLPLTA